MPTLSQAFAILDEVISSIDPPAVEELSISQCRRRFLAKAQRAKVDLPAFNKSAMDGYAILDADRKADVREYRVIEIVAAGAIPTQSLQPGTTIKVMTGAPVPKGAQVIVPHEMTAAIAELQDQKIKILSWPQSNNICLQGEDMKIGDLVLERGCALNPVAIANLAASGITKVPVYRRLKAAIISTGSEIVDDFAKLNGSKIMNSNGPMLAALCDQYGIEVEKNVIAADDFDTIRQTIKEALLSADMILLSGGVSAGDFDFVNDALRKLEGEIHFSSVDMKPGKPTVFATISAAADDSAKNNAQQKILFGLPGNPVAVFLAFHLFVLRAVRALCGGMPYKAHINFPLAKKFQRRETARVAYIPCRLEPNGTITPVDFHGSAHLAALLNCDGFLVVPKGVAEILEGEQGQFFMLNF